MTPALDAFASPPAPYDKIAPILILLSATALAIRPDRSLVAITLGCMLVLGLADQQRWQPWFYQYGLMLLPFAFHKWGNPDDQTRNAIIAQQQIIIAGIYLWSGLHKCHPSFIAVYQTNLIKPILNSLEIAWLIDGLKATAYLVPVTEIAIAIGLLFQRVRFYALLGVVATHAVILFLIGPVQGKITNSVVWPWNVVMVALAFTAFHRSAPPLRAAFASRRLLPVGVLIAALVLPAPALFYIGSWDRYLSFNLYSGKQRRLLVKIEAEAEPFVPESWRPYLAPTKAADNHKILNVANWSLQELNVPLVTEWRILRGFARDIAAPIPAEIPVTFYIDHPYLPNEPKRYFTREQIDEIGR